MFPVAGYCQSPSREEVYALQERCGIRAEQVFNRDYPVALRTGRETFKNHYNSKLNKCYIFEVEMVQLKDGSAVSFASVEVLYDVNDNKVVGRFDPLGCSVAGTTCSSEKDFRSLIRLYMEE
jgi:hypothetical protein